MYTLDQQLKDIDEAIEILKNKKQKETDPYYLCHIAESISENFYEFIKRAFKRIDKISPKSYRTSLVDVYMIKKYIDSKTSPSIWLGWEYESRLQFLNDLKEDIIENG